MAEKHAFHFCHLLQGNFGTIFVDQSYWQSSVAAKPKQGVIGFLLGGICWFAIPFGLATTTSLAYIALSASQNQALLSDSDVDAGKMWRKGIDVIKWKYHIKVNFFVKLKSCSEIVYKVKWTNASIATHVSPCKPLSETEGKKSPFIFLRLETRTCTCSAFEEQGNCWLHCQIV